MSPIAAWLGSYPISWGGSLPSSMAVMGDVTQHIGTGKLRALAVTSEKRSRFPPNVPTFAELGFGEVTGVDWYGLLAPRRRPLHPAQAEFAKRIQSETLRWGPVVKASGFTAES